MKLVVTSTKQEILYDKNNVFLNGKRCASYNEKQVIWLADSNVLAQLMTYADHSWTHTKDFGDIVIEAHDQNKTLKDLRTGIVIGRYEGLAAGAVASYIAYMHAKKLGYVITPTTISSNLQRQTNKTASPTPKPQHQILKSEPLKPKTKKQVPKYEPPKPQPEKQIPKYEPPKPQPEKQIPKYEPPKPQPEKQIPKYEPPKPQPEKKVPEYEPPKEYDYKKKDPPKDNMHIPPIIPGGGSGDASGGGSGFGSILAVVLGILFLFVAIKLIPSSWKDLSTYIPKGDIGIIISFFTPVAGAIIAILYSIIKKNARFFELNPKS